MLNDNLIFLSIAICTLLFVWVGIIHFKARCEALVESWIAKNVIKVSSRDVSIQWVTYPLQATVAGLDKDGIGREYTLQLGGTWRGSVLKEAQVLKIELL